jgi:cell division transport system permease protein
MLGWIFASPAERRLLSGGRLRGPTPWVIAIMSFSIMIIAASGLALTNTASLLSNAIQARYSVEVPAGARNLDALLRAVRSAPGVVSANAVPEAEMRRTLQRWLGPGAASDELPVPALINFDLRPGADLAAIQSRISAVSPDARVAAHRETVRPLLNSLRLLQWVALGLVLLLSAAAAAAVVLAARGALDTNRSTIDVMHGVGATDLQVTHLFQRRIAIDALTGSLIGAAAAAVVLLLLATGAAFAGQLTGGATLGLGDFIILALLPLALTVLATRVARAAVLAALREAL